MNNNEDTKELELHDPDKESMSSAEVFKIDNRIKRSSQYNKNRKGLRFIDCIDFKSMTEDEIIEQLTESWNPKNGYKFKIKKTYVKRKNIMSGQMFYERYDTPYYCSPSSETYWSM